MSSDAALLTDWSKGDGNAGQALFERHFEPLYRFFRSKAPQHCEELVQLTFKACLEKRETLGGVTSFRSFLYGVARFELLRLFRRLGKAAKQVDIGDLSLCDLDPSPSRVAADKQEHRLLLEALRRIPIDLQIVLELHYWEELSTQEIADVLSVPQGTIKTRIRRARVLVAEAIASLSSNAQLLESTTEGFERWVVDVKALFDG